MLSVKHWPGWSAGQRRSPFRPPDGAPKCTLEDVPVLLGAELRAPRHGSASSKRFGTSVKCCVKSALGKRIMVDSLGQWPSAPLVYVLAEVRYSPILDLAKRAAAVQELLKPKFPLLEPTAEITLAPGVTPSTLYAFSDATRRRGVVLSGNGVYYQVTEYETSHEFFQQLGQVLEAIEPVYAKETVIRLGLRYVDAIAIEKGESVFDYITTTMGGTQLDGGEQTRVQCVIERLRSNGGITVRLLSLGIPLYRSPDLPALGLRHPGWVEKAMERQVPAATLDTDNWTMTVRSFDAAALLESFKELKNGITETFLKVATEQAVERWKSTRRNT
jgi:uncharacterized protein (TIGR04255 family)